MKVQLPDGKIAEFPDDMPQGEVARIIGKQYGGPSAPQSAITGQPEPTMEQKVSGSKKFIAGTLPIAGDLALSAVAPQATIAKNIPRAIRLGKHALNLGSRMFASGAGGAGGEWTGQQITGEHDPEQIAIQGAAGAAGELLWPVAKILGKTTGKAVENITASGRMIKGFLRDRVESKAIARAKGFVEEIAPDAVKSLKRDNVGIAINDAMDETTVLYNKYKGALKSAEDANGEIYLNDTVDALNERVNFWREKGKTLTGAENTVIKEFGYTPGSEQGRFVKKLVSGDPVDGKDLEWFFANIQKGKAGSKYTDLSPSTQTVRQNLKKGMLGDFAQFGGEDAAAAKIAADKAYGAIAEYRDLYRLWAKNLRDTPRGIQFNPEKLAKDIMGQKRRVMAKNPELWTQLEQEAQHYFDVGRKLKQSRVEEIRGSWGAGGAVGWVLLGPKGGATIETIGALSALGSMSDTAAAIISGTAKTGLKTGLHLGGQMIEFPGMQQAH